MDPEVVAACILDILSELFVLDQHQFSLSCSIGIAVADTAGNIDADRLIRLSDREKYKTKRTSGNRYSLFFVIKGAQYQHALRVKHPNFRKSAS